MKPLSLEEIYQMSFLGVAEYHGFDSYIEFSEVAGLCNTNSWEEDYDTYLEWFELSQTPLYKALT